MKHIGQHAIVIGASMGGLLAARALSDFYAVVTVLELHMAARYDAKLATAISRSPIWRRRRHGCCNRPW